MSDPHWLVEDFWCLYRSAERALLGADRMTHGLTPTAGDTTAVEVLRLQLDRLRPAFDMCDAERRGDALTGLRRYGETGSDEVTAEAPPVAGRSKP